MNTIFVQYRPRPDAADTNLGLIEAVFEQLANEQPDSLDYLSLRLDDGTFIHIAHTTGDTNPLPDLDTFQAFSRSVADRCNPQDRPNAQGAHVVGHYPSPR